MLYSRSYNGFLRAQWIELKKNYGIPLENFALYFLEANNGFGWRCANKFLLCFLIELSWASWMVQVWMFSRIPYLLVLSNREWGSWQEILFNSQTPWGYRLINLHWGMFKPGLGLCCWCLDPDWVLLTLVLCTENPFRVPSDFCMCVLFTVHFNSFTSILYYNSFWFSVQI